MCWVKNNLTCDLAAAHKNWRQETFKLTSGCKSNCFPLTSAEVNLKVYCPWQRIHIQRSFREFARALDKFWLVESSFFDTRSSEGRYCALWKVIVRWSSTDLVCGLVSFKYAVWWNSMYLYKTAHSVPHRSNSHYFVYMEPIGHWINTV